MTLKPKAERQPSTTAVVNPMAVFREGQELSRAEELGSPAWLMLVADTVPACLCYLDKEERVQFYNRMYRDWFCKPGEDGIGKTVREVVGEELYSNRKERLYRAYAGTSVHFRAFTMLADGTLRDCSISYVPFTVRAEVLGVLVMLQDVSELQRTAGQLKRSEDRYRSLLQATNDIVWSTRPDGVFLEDQVSWQEYTGQEPHEYVDNAIKAIHPDDADQVAEAWFKALREQERFTQSFRLFHKSSGTYRQVISRGVPVLSEDGQVVEWVGTMSDVQDLFEAESQLAQARRFAEEILRTTPDTVFVMDLRSKRISFASPQVLEQLGYMPEEVSAMDTNALLALAHPDDLDGIREVFKRWPKATDEDVFEYEYRIKAKNSHWRWVTNRARVFRRDPDGVPTHIVAFCIVIDKRKRAEQALRESELRFRTITEGGSHFIWGAKANGEGDYYNPQLLSYLGKSMGDLGGWDLLESVHPDDQERAVGEWKNAYQTGEAFDTECRLRRAADGEFRWFNMEFLPVKDAEDKVARWYGVVTDITELKEHEAVLERRVRERTFQLEAAIRELEGFTYSVSHDLRAPLRAINATSAMLKADYGNLLPDSAIEELKMQSEAARKMSVLIEELLKLSRISRGTVAQEHVDLTDLAGQVAATMRNTGSVNAVQFEIAEGLELIGDQSLLELVLRNLFENACKFSPQGGVVRLGRTPDGAFFVADEGVGFEMEFAEKLWVPFERLHSYSEFPGTGIGLTNVKRIIERHKGKVWAESELGKGATFYFTVGAEQGQS